MYASGIKRCPDCVPLWRAAARLEEGQGNVGRARALLEQVSRACVSVGVDTLTNLWWGFFGGGVFWGGGAGRVFGGWAGWRGVGIML